MEMWAALRTCPHLHRPYDYDYDDEDHLATYTLDGTHTYTHTTHHTTHTPHSTIEPIAARWKASD